MSGKVKGLLSGIGGIGIAVLVVIAFFTLVVGGAKLFEVLDPILQTIGGFAWGVIILLLIISVVPKFRAFTGSGIIWSTYLIGAILWFTSFFVTYSLWGVLGIIIGVLFMGLGVFFTAILALIFHGEFGAGLTLAISLAIIYFTRWLGYWIASKHTPKVYKTHVVSKELESKILSGKGDIADWMKIDGHITPEADEKIEP